jgi:hypothetical protein
LGAYPGYLKRRADDPVAQGLTWRVGLGFKPKCAIEFTNAAKTHFSELSDPNPPCDF